MKARIVGRRKELARLGALLERARRGEGGTVLLCGEAGVGKTRLLAELAAATDAQVLRGAPTHGASAPYAPITAALRGHLQARAPAGHRGGGRGRRARRIGGHPARPPRGGRRPRARDRAGELRRQSSDSSGVVASACSAPRLRRAEPDAIAASATASATAWATFRLKTLGMM